MDQPGEPLQHETEMMDHATMTENPYTNNDDRDVDSSPLDMEGPPEEPRLTLEVSYARHVFEYEFPPEATLDDFLLELEESLDIPVANQKIIVPKMPLIKAPLKNPEMHLSELAGKKILLMGSSAKKVKSVQQMVEAVNKRNVARRANLPLRRKPRVNRADLEFTFLNVKPLQDLPRPDRSMMLLMRLKNDPGIVAVMRKHKFQVGLLTEMEPLSNTQSTHEGTTRLLGLNRNKGECIELRLRTDAHDGYRDYKTIRKTLCHELAHNVHGPHDRQFWDLCHQIEREVDRADWLSSGRTLGEYPRNAPPSQEEDHEDEGGWKGGEYVLGGVRARPEGLSRREIRAQAALMRMNIEKFTSGTRGEDSGSKKRKEGSPAPKERK